MFIQLAHQIGLGPKSRNSPNDYDKFSVMPQRGYGLQPRVAASATLGKESHLALNRNAVASALCIPFRENDATALRLKFLFLLVPRVAEAATLGWRPQPRWGITETLS